MKKISYHISRLGLGITFLWIGVLIFKNPEGWATYLQPWAANLMPFPIVPAMIATAFFDAAVGVLLLLDVYVWLVSLVGAGHIFIVLIVSGITEVTVRDIAILYCSTALSIETLPDFVTRRFPFLS